MSILPPAALAIVRGWVRAPPVPVEEIVVSLATTDVSSVGIVAAPFAFTPPAVGGAAGAFATTDASSVGINCGALVAAEAAAGAADCCGSGFCGNTGAPAA